MDTLSQWFGNCQQWLFETLVQPALFHLGLSNFIEDGYDATMWLLVGLLQVAVLLLVFGPLQRLRPVEPVTDRRQIGLGFFELTLGFVDFVLLALGLGFSQCGFAFLNVCFAFVDGL